MPTRDIVAAVLKESTHLLIVNYGFNTSWTLPKFNVGSTIPEDELMSACLDELFPDAVISVEENIGEREAPIYLCYLHAGNIMHSNNILGSAWTRYLDKHFKVDDLTTRVKDLIRSKSIACL